MGRDMKDSYEQRCWEAALRNYERRLNILREIPRGRSPASDLFLDRMQEENNKLEREYPILKEFSTCRN